MIRIGKKRSMYGSKLVKIPTPRFVVFYNGEKETEERFEYKLSDAYIVGTDEPELELKVTVLNINPGNNEKLLEQCKTLKEYSRYVSIVRENLLHMDIDEAVESAVNYCIRNNILADFFLRNKAEVMKVAIFECNVEEEMKKIGNDYYENGLEEGKLQGLEEGKLDTMLSLYSEGLITKEVALEKLEMSEEEFMELLAGRLDSNSNI